jgi:hypothetical protein
MGESHASPDNFAHSKKGAPKFFPKGNLGSAETLIAIFEITLFDHVSIGSIIF